MEISQALLGRNDVIYIGRGHKGFGLARSKWANPFPIDVSSDRKRVIKRFGAYLSDAVALKRDLEELGGKMIACHCPFAHLVCRGDVLAQTYRDEFCGAQSRPPEDSEVKVAKEGREQARRRREDTMDI